MSYDNEQYKAYCPHCHKEIEMRLSVKLKSLEAGTGSDALLPGQLRREALTDAQKTFLDAARANGLLAAFAEAVGNGPMADHAPKDMELFLLHVLRTTKQKVIPRNALSILLDGFGRTSGKLDFFAAQGVGIVTIDRHIRAFVPVQFVYGESVTGANGTAKFHTENDEDLLRRWIKTKMGYVPAGVKEFLDSVRKRSIGDFANPVL